MKYFLGTLLLFVSIMLMAQQRPFISSLSKTSGTAGETVVISGSNFATDFNDMQVHFGAGKATVVGGSASQLEVLVPNTATYGPVKVTNLSTGRSASSKQQFTLSFGGSTFDPDQLDNQVNYPTNNNLTTDLCTCDFDGDGQIDAAVSNAQSPSVNIFRNDPGTDDFTDISATALDQQPGFETVGTECGDLNGDGKPDLIFTAANSLASSHVIILQNTSSGTTAFSTVFSFRLPSAGGSNRSPRAVRIADLDGDGKPELIVSNQSDNTIHIYMNTSTTSLVSFASTPVEIRIESATSTGTIEVGDLNGNGLSDIVFSAYRTNSQVYILPNESTQGNVRFGNSIALDGSENRTSIKLADLNDDGFPEIVTSIDTDNQLKILTNITGSKGETPAFNVTHDIQVNNAWGIASGDINGDGQVDLLVTSTTNVLFYLENSNTSESINLEASVAIPTTSTPRYSRIVDINGDAKPDLVFTHRSLSNTPGHLSVIINRNCLTPTISPAGLTFCTGSGNAFTLTTTNASEATYDWTFDPPLPPANILSQTGNEIEIYVSDGTTSIEAEVTITANDGSCTDVATETFTLTGGTDPAPPTINIDQSGIICSGQAFTLTAPAGQETYLWTLPDGTTSSNETLTIDSATAENAGTYSLRVQPPAGCFSPEKTRTVEVDEPPLVSIVNTGDDNVCVGTSVTLEVPVYDGFSYQWKRNGADTGDGLGTLEVSESGDYTVTVISDATSCETESPAYTINVVSEPVSSFTAVEEVCTGVEMSFTATSTGDEFDVNYTWDFGDGSSSTEPNPVHTFSTAGDYDVVLTTAYNEVAACSSEVTKTITVSDPPNLTIEAAGGSFEKCPADSVRLELPEGHTSYTWSTGDTDYFTWAKTGAEEDEVEVTAEVVTDIGCVVDDIPPAVVSNYANSRIEIASPEAQMTEDVINLEGGVSTVKLTAANGTDYTWEPAELIQVTGTGESVVVYPKDRETVVTVTGTDVLNGCETTAAVTIITPGLIARKSFSPNGDGMGFDCWEILNSDNLQGCEVYVFDQRGSYVFRGTSPFEDNCVWNGNIDNGSSPAPEGIYYFVMKCDNNDSNQTGTILLGR